MGSGNVVIEIVFVDDLRSDPYTFVFGVPLKQIEKLLLISLRQCIFKLSYFGQLVLVSSCLFHFRKHPYCLVVASKAMHRSINKREGFGRKNLHDPNLVVSIIWLLYN